MLTGSHRLSDAKESRAIYAYAVFSLVLCAACFFLNHRFFHDDAYISLRYALNFADGNGIVWNPGDRLEGYSNFLFLVLSGLLTWLGCEPVTASRSINLLSLAALVLFSLRFFTSLGQDLGGGERRLAAVLATAFILSSFGLIVWTLGGLEGPFFSMLCALGAWTFCRTPPSGRHTGELTLSSLFFGLAYLTRQEAALFFAVALAFLLLQPGRAGLKRACAFFIPFGSLVLAHSAWREFYYGDLLPNTYHLKAAGLSLTKLKVGVAYVAAFAKSPPFLLPLALVSAVYSVLRGEYKREMLLLAACISVFAAYVALVGGDHMPSFRLLLPLIPLCSTLICVALITIIHSRPGPAVHLAGMAICGLLFLQMFSNVLNPKVTDAAAFVGKIAGGYIASNWKSDSLIALNTAGATPYYAHHNTYIDMLGLNDRHIARRKDVPLRLAAQRTPGHMKGDGKYVLERDPDFIIIGPAEGTSADDPWFLSDLEIAESPLFHQNYQMRRVYLDVRNVEGFEDHFATASGLMTFTFYEKK